MRPIRPRLSYQGRLQGMTASQPRKLSGLPKFAAAESVLWRTVVPCGRASKLQLHFPRSALNTTNWFRVQYRSRTVCISLGHDCHHSDAHVENLIHLLTIDVSVFLQDLENARNTPFSGVYHCITIFWQNARQIVNEPAAGDMGQAFNHAAWNFCQERLIILVHPQQFSSRRCLSSRAGANLV